MPRDIIENNEFVFEFTTDANGYATARTAQMCREALCLIALD